MTVTTTPRSAGTPLRARRAALGISRIELAGVVGFSPAHIAQLEGGYRPRRGDALQRIERALSDLERTPGNERRPAAATQPSATATADPNGL